jgi:hypothetical protein
MEAGKTDVLAEHQRPAARQPREHAATRRLDPVQCRRLSYLLVFAFLLVMGFLVGITVDGDRRLPDLTQVSSAVVTALLGGVINPGYIPRRLWASLAVLALAVAVLAAVYVFAFPAHRDAGPAVMAAIAAFVGLISDTASWTHLGSERS